MIGQNHVGSADTAVPQCRTSADENNEMKSCGIWEVTCYDKDGNLKWEDTIENMIVDEGLTAMLEEFFNGAAYTAAHFIGLTDGTPTVAAGDLMSSHAGWAEVHAAYSEAARQAYSPGAAANKSIDNDAAKAVFNFTGPATVGGCFCTDVNTKGGTTGMLVSAGAFTQGDKNVDNGDVLNVKLTYSNAST